MEHSAAKLKGSSQAPLKSLSQNGLAERLLRGSLRDSLQVSLQKFSLQVSLRVQIKANNFNVMIAPFRRLLKVLTCEFSVPNSPQCAP